MFDFVEKGAVKGEDTADTRVEETHLDRMIPALLEVARERRR
ncbi:MAG TPA: hypothetical protein VF188_04130 [Longimicrobiales bacterium]